MQSRAIHQSVAEVLSSAGLSEGIAERRTDARSPYPNLIRLIPVGKDGWPEASEITTVVGKQISTRGLGFFHKDDLPYQRVIASFDAGEGKSVCMLLELEWCRFTDHGWYESGGRFLKRLDGQLC